MTKRTGEEAPPPQPAPPFDKDEHAYVRLHITPLDPDLLKVVLSTALLPKARGISYHTLETFPEKRYGFLELPNEDAEKLKKKLNGSVLRGVKIRIERARPSGSPAPLGDAAMAKEKTSKKTADGSRPPKDKSKKRKRDAEELTGVVLEGGRKIKRGWTSADEPKERRSKKDKEKKSKDKKKQPKSKYTDHPECLIKTVLPPNAAPTTDADQSTPTKKKKKGKSREVVVHEFEKTTKFPTFLKTAAATGPPSAPLEFVDGKGWVNADGDVVETVKARAPASATVLILGKSTKKGKKATTNEESATSSSEDESAEDSGPESPVAADGGNSDNPDQPAAEEPNAPSSPSLVNADLARPKSPGSSRSLSITIPPATPNEPKVHPLEALYKRTQQADGETPKTAAGGQGFSFFADGNDESADDDVDADAGESLGVQLPMTPFTRQDLEMRGIRSAAPTPDTAHPSRRFTPWEPNNDDGQQDDDDEAVDDDFEEDEQVTSNSTTVRGGEGEGKPPSDFQTLFWQTRGDINRSWKKRRKIAGKEKRYRENKARMARAI